MKYKTMSDVRAANRAGGQHFFSAGAMRFFNSKVESALYSGRYFITSERFRFDDPKAYTVREVMEKGASIETVGEFCQYKNIEDARAEIRRLLKLPVRSYYVHFHGRHAGAIGVFVHMSATIEAQTEIEFARKFYDKYELSGQRVTTVALDGPGEVYRKFNFWDAMTGKPGFEN
jgi:hypothetical protein